MPRLVFGTALDNVVANQMIQGLRVVFIITKRLLQTYFP